MPILENKDIFDISKGNPLQPLADILDLLDEKTNKAKATMIEYERIISKIGKTGNGQEAKALIQNTTKLSEETQRLINIKKAKLTIENQIQKAEAKFIAIQESKLGTYQKESALLNKLRTDYKNLEAAGLGYTKQAKQMLNQITQLDTKLKRIDASVGQHTRNVGNYGKALSNLGATIKNFFFAGGILVLIQKIGQFFRKSTIEADYQSKAIGKIEQAIISTGGAANKTSKYLQDMASALQENSIFGDEKIMNDVIAQLLTFTNISGQEFDKATQAALDMNTVLGGDLKSNTIQLGKALNDPIKGISALRRIGIQFSDDQEKVIKQLVKTGEVAKAQQLILAEINREFGGQAKRAAEEGLGPLQKLQNSWSDFRELIGTGLNVVINKFANIAGKALGKFIDFTKRSIAYVVDFINGWIELYNESMAFRAVVNAIGSTFNLVWQSIKLFFSLIIDNLKGMGKAFSYTFNPKNWGAGFYEGLKKVLFENRDVLRKDVVDYGKNIADDFNKGLENIRSGKKKLITLDFSTQGTQAEREFSEGFGNSLEQDKKIDKSIKGLAQRIGREFASSPDIKNAISEIRNHAKEIEKINKDLLAKDQENSLVWQQMKLDEAKFWEELDAEQKQAELDRLAELEAEKKQIIGETLSAAGEALGELMTNGELSIKEFGKFILKTFLSVTENMIQLSLARLFAEEVASKSFAGLVTFPILAGLVKGFFAGIKSKIASFAEGTDRVVGPGTQKSDSIRANLSRDEGVAPAEINMKLLQMGVGVTDKRLPAIVSAGLSFISMQGTLNKISASNQMMELYLSRGKNIYVDSNGKFTNFENWNTGGTTRSVNKKKLDD